MRRMLAIAVLALATIPAAGQGCALCYKSAQDAGSQAQAGLRRGITLLVIPPVAIMGVIVGYAFKRRDSRD